MSIPKIGSDGKMTFTDSNGDSIAISPDGGITLSNSSGSSVELPVDGSGEFSIDLSSAIGSISVSGEIGPDGRPSVSEVRLESPSFDVGNTVVKLGVNGYAAWSPSGGAKLGLDGGITLFGKNPEQIADKVKGIVEGSTTGRIFGTTDEYYDYCEREILAGRQPLRRPQWLALQRSLGAFDESNGFWQGALSWIAVHDPLSLDIDGDGIETLGRNDAILFDHSGANLVNATGWVKPDDGFLAYDRNGNGIIDNGSELFGIDTVMSNGKKANSGFQALKDFDANNDGRIDGSDGIYSSLRVWQDADSDAVTDAGELKTLAELNIASINVNASGGTVNLGNGNTTSGSAIYTRTDGTTGTAYNLDLAVNAYQREYKDDLPVPVEFADLPDMAGTGRVRDLVQAAIRSPDLAAKVEQFSAGTTRDAQMAVLDDLLAEWANSSEMLSSVDEARARKDVLTVLVYKVPGIQMLTFGEVSNNLANSGESGGGIDLFEHLSRDAYTEEYKAWLDRLGTLERFNGQHYFNVPRAEQLLLKQTVEVSVSVGEPGGSTGSGSIENTIVDVYEIQLSTEQKTLLEKSYAELREAVYGVLVVQTRLKPYTDEVGLVMVNNQLNVDFSAMNALFEERRQADAVSAFTDLIELNRYAGRNLFLQGWTGTDMLRGWMQQPLSAEVQAVLAELHASQVNGSVTGTTANEIFIGGTLVDTINSGEGHDLIDGGGGNDTLDSGLGNDVLLGGAGADTLRGGAGSDLLVGGDVNDSLISDNGGETSNCDDDLYGGAGNDSLSAGAGDDYLDGGTGNDTLSGFNGNDIYVFGRGDGQDSINNSGSYGASDGVDIIRFKSDVSVNDISVRADDYGALILFNLTSGDSISVGSHFSSDQTADPYYQEYYRRYSIDFVEFSDGTRWTKADINNLYLSQNQTGLSDTVRGFYWSDSLSGGLGNDTIYGNGGDDIISGGAGNDTLRGGTGIDQLSGGDGSDYLYGDDGAEIGAGTDQLYGGAGSDLLAGGFGDDLLVGGAGSDTLYGHQGNDVYLFNAGDGSDIIISASNAAINGDIVRFGEGILKEGFFLNREASDYNSLIMINAVTGNTIRISGHFTSDSATAQATVDVNTYQRIGRFEFANGDVWTASDVSQLYAMQHTTVADDLLYGFRWSESYAMGSGNDVVYAYAGNDAILGEAGNDTLNGGDNDDMLDGGMGNDILRGGTGIDQLYGGDGNDFLYGDDGGEIGTGADLLSGGAGDDSLFGAIGNDSLRGGTGADTLSGGSGSDVYLFGRGDGADMVVESDSTAGVIDILSFDSGIAYDQLWFKRMGSGLEVSVIGSTDKVTINNWYGGASYHVERIQVAEGNFLVDTQVELLVQAMAGMSPPGSGQMTLTTDQRQQLEPVLASTWQTA